MPFIEKRRFPGGITGYCSAAAEGNKWRVWCYRIGDTLIDTGCPRGLPGLVAAIRADGALRRIFVTHHHEDHSGNADAIRAATGARVYVTRYSAPLVRRSFKVLRYQKIMWGVPSPWEPDEVFDLPPRGTAALPGTDFIIMHTPGHAHDMTVVYHAATRTLISADLYLADRIRYVRRDEDLTLVMESLRRVLNRFEVENLLCAHRPTVGRGREALAAKLAFLEETQERLFALLQDGASLKRAVAEVLGGEDRLVRRFTSGDVSVTNLAQNLLGGARPRRDVIAAVGEAWAWQRFNDHLDGENVRVRSSGRLQA